MGHMKVRPPQLAASCPWPWWPGWRGLLWQPLLYKSPRDAHLSAWGRVLVGRGHRISPWILPDALVAGHPAWQAKQFPWQPPLTHVCNFLHFSFPIQILVKPLIISTLLNLCLGFLVSSFLLPQLVYTYITPVPTLISSKTEIVFKFCIQTPTYISSMPLNHTQTFPWSLLPATFQHLTSPNTWWQEKLRNKVILARIIKI